MIDRQMSGQSTSRGNSVEQRGRKWQLSSLTTLLFYAFVIYMVVPIADVPLLGLSLSAPILFLIALEVFARMTGLTWRHYARWLAFAYVFWLALLLSLAGNVLFGNITDFGTHDVLNLVRWAYWMIVFVITIILIASDVRLARKAVWLIGLAIVGVALLRVGEALLFGRWGNATSRIFTQNGYGWLFSAFTPYAVLLIYKAKGWQHLAALATILALFAAIAGNGSRSSWIAATAGVVVFMILYALAQRTTLRTLWFPVAVGLTALITISVVPDRIIEPVQQRFASFEDLDTDKPYLVRQLMVQKSLTMFEQSPFIGKGVGRFTSTYVPLRIPPELQYRSEAGHNRRSAHNSYAALLGETGLLGSVPYALLLLVLAFQGLRAAIRLGRGGETWAIAVYAGFIGTSIHFWTLAGLTGTVPWFIYGMMAGMIEYEQNLTSSTNVAV